MAWLFAADEAPGALVLEQDASPAPLTFTPAPTPSDLWFEEDFMAVSPNSALATSRLLSAAASVNATVVKASAGTVKRVTGYNARSSAVYLKLYNQAGTPASMDTPRKTIYLPTATAFSLEMDDYFSAGIGYRLTTGNADNDTGALSSGDILGLNVDYL